MKKLLKIMGVVAVCAASCVMVYNQVNAKPENSIFAQNIEALSQSEGIIIGPVVCYNFYDSPGIFVDDEFRRVCQDPEGRVCVMYEGHDFTVTSICIIH